MKLTFAAALLASGMLISTPSKAEEMTLLPEGQTLIALSVTERTQVQQDTLHASLRIELTDKTAAGVQDKINTAMKKAVEATKSAKDVKTSTGYYSVYQTYADPNNPRSVKSWNGSQTIDIESKNAQAVLELAGKIQEAGFAMNNLQYTLSTEKADEIRDGLMEAALKRAQAKADRAAKGLGKKSVELVQVGVDSPVDFAQPVMMRAMAKGGMEAADAFSAPTAQAGESEVSLTVNVRAIAK